MDGIRLISLCFAPVCRWDKRFVKYCIVQSEQTDTERTTDPATRYTLRRRGCTEQNERTYMYIDDVCMWQIRLLFASIVD